MHTYYRKKYWPVIQSPSLCILSPSKVAKNNNSKHILRRMSYCNGCGRTFNGSRGLAIHKGKTGCGQSNNYYSKRDNFSSFLNVSVDEAMVQCNDCGRSFKGNHGLAIHKAKSGCGLIRNSTSSVSFNQPSSSNDLIMCNDCGRSFKGNHGLAIHRAKRECGLIRNSTSSVSFNQPSSSNDLIRCNDCGRSFKGNHGLAIHRAKSECRLTSNPISNSSHSKKWNDCGWCNTCQKQFNGSLGLAIHKGKTKCGSNINYSLKDNILLSSKQKRNNSSEYNNNDDCQSIASSSFGYKSLSSCSINSGWCNTCNKQFKGSLGLAIHKRRSNCGCTISISKSEKQTTYDISGFCEDCGRRFKGKLGLSIHRAKSTCGQTKESCKQDCIDTCRKWVNTLQKQAEIESTELFEEYLEPNQPNYYGHKNVTPSAESRNAPNLFTESNNPSNPYPSKDDSSWCTVEDDDLTENDIAQQDSQNDIAQQDSQNKTKEEKQDALNTKKSDDNNNSKGVSSKKELNCDVSLIVKYENQPTVILKAHRSVLSLASSVFKDMFSKSKKFEEIISDVSPKGMENMMVHIYKNETVVNNFDDAIDTLQAAKKFEIEELETKCLEYIIKEINIDNICELLDYSVLEKVKELQEECIEFITKDIQAVLSIDNFLDLISESLIIIANLCVDKKLCDVTILAKYLIKWSKKQCRDQELYESEENLNSLLEPIVDVLDSECSNIIGNLIRESSVEI